MKFDRLMISFAFLMVLVPLMVSCGQKNEAPQPSSSTIAIPDYFTGEEKQLVAKLFELWTKKGHVASVDQAADALGVTVSDSVRIDLLNKFKQNLNIHERLGRYRANTFILTNEEKMIAEHIMVSEKKNQEFPSLEQISGELKMSPEHIKERLRFLSAAEMFFDLGGPDEYNKLGFSYGHKLADFTFDLGLRQHIFKVDGGKPINVGCAKEAFFIVATEYPKSKIEYRTYDPVSLEPIDVVFDDNEIKSINPESAKLMEGGTCGANNLFINEANAKAYAATMPKFQNREAPIFDLKPRFEDTKKTAAESK
ncbi:MAG: hypothetical protein WBP42_09050 [Candidatus Zixiibacteriota bacterium]